MALGSFSDADCVGTSKKADFVARSDLISIEPSTGVDAVAGSVDVISVATAAVPPFSVEGTRMESVSLVTGIVDSGRVLETIFTAPIFSSDAVISSGVKFGEGNLLVFFI